MMKMPIVNGRQYRGLVLPLEPVKENKRFDTDYYVEGYATTFDKPYELYEFDGVKYYEVIDRNALNEADMNDIIMQYNHQGRVLSRMKNNTLIVEPDERGIFVAADLSKSNAARELYEDIENGLITRMSWAFSVGEESYDRDTRTVTIKRVKKVYDVSPVSIPASEDTEISARSLIDGVIEKERQELLERQKQQEEEQRKLLAFKLNLYRGL